MRTQIEIAQENTRLAAVAMVQTASIQINNVASEQSGLEKRLDLNRGVVSGVSEPSTLPYDPMTNNV